MQKPFNPRRLKSASASALAALLAAMLLMPDAGAQTAYRWVGKDGRVHYSDQPPPPVDAKDMKVQKLRGGNVVDTGGAFSYETQQATKNFPLTLYTSENCTDNCKMARNFLAQRGAPYEEKLIKTAEDLAEFKKASGSQEATVPLLMAGKRLEKGYEEGAWNRLLDGAGYPAKGNPANTVGAKEAAKP